MNDVLHPDELALRRAIAWSPLDLNPRFALADWLMEQDDPQTRRQGEWLAKCLPPGQQHRIFVDGLPQVRKLVDADFLNFWHGFPSEWRVYGWMHSPTARNWGQLYRLWPFHETDMNCFQPRYQPGTPFVWQRRRAGEYALSPRIIPGIWERLRPNDRKGDMACYSSSTHAKRDLAIATTNHGRSANGMPEVEFPRPWEQATHTTIRTANAPLPT